MTGPNRTPPDNGGVRHDLPLCHDCCHDLRHTESLEKYGFVTTGTRGMPHHTPRRAHTALHAPRRYTGARGVIHTVI